MTLMPDIMGSADPQESVLIPVVAGRCILLGSDSGLFLFSQPLLRALTQRLHPFNCTRRPPYFRADLPTTNETNDNTGTDDECQNESVFAV